MSARRWTEAEDLVVRHHYPRLPLSDLAAALGRTEAATRRRANGLGVTMGGRAPLAPAANAKRPWTADDDDVIRESWGFRPPRAIATQLGRSVTAVWVRKKRLGAGASVNLLTSRAVASLFGVDSHLVMRWVRDGLLRATKAGLRCARNRMWNIDQASLEGFIRAHPEAYDWRRMESGYHRDLAENTWRVDPLLTVADVCRLHGVSQGCISNAILGGRLPAVRGHGPNRLWYIRRSAARRWRPVRPELVGHRGRGRRAIEPRRRTA